jgi:hypothetical protein
VVRVTTVATGATMVAELGLCGQWRTAEVSSPRGWRISADGDGSAPRLGFQGWRGASSNDELR